MSELKTLKDIRASWENDGEKVGLADDIKDQAIKWYKYHERQINEINEHSSENKQVMRMMSINGWLFNFFNIKDGDLNEN